MAIHTCTDAPGCAQHKMPRCIAAVTVQGGSTSAVWLSCSRPRGRSTGGKNKAAPQADDRLCNAPGCAQHNT
jgi:hypothetical protein